MANEENLRPAEYAFKSAEEAQRMGQKGGIASGESRRRKRTLREMVEIFGELGVSDKTRKMMKELDIPEDLMTRKMQPVVALYNKAGKGDVAAFNAIRDITGEKPVDETKVTGNIATEITINLIHTGIKPVNDESEIR
jgi:hypothetical protein